MTISALAGDIVLIVIALAVARLAALARAGLPARAGAIVMAIGIFARSAWHSLPWADGPSTRALALVLLLAWATVAASVIGARMRGVLSRYYQDPIDSFAIGTWVAGTAVSATVMIQTFPGWPAAAAVLAVVAVLLWLWYLGLAARGFRALASDPARRQATGTILLSTVSTQSLVIMVQSLWPETTITRALPFLIGLGYLFYAVGLLFVTQRYQRQPGWRLCDDWHNTNCIMHGALSITGLAALTSGRIAAPVIALTWFGAVLMLALVEGIELARLSARLRAYGWRRGLAAYDVTQWARNFTFGMFYAFTLAMHHSAAGAQMPPPLSAMQQAIVVAGQYVVLAFLCVECGLFLADRPVAVIRQEERAVTRVARTR